MWLGWPGNKLNNAESLFAQMSVPHRTGKQPASQGQLQEWTEHSHRFFENLKPVEIS